LFTYVHRAVLEDPQSFVGTEKLFATLKAAREEWTFGIEPSVLPEFLAQRGLSLEQDVGAAEYRYLYWKEAAWRMRGYEFYRIAVARVPGHAAQQTPGADPPPAEPPPPGVPGRCDDDGQCQISRARSMWRRGCLP
jgi:hypothetical protein